MVTSKAMMVAMTLVKSMAMVAETVDGKGDNQRDNAAMAVAAATAGRTGLGNIVRDGGCLDGDMHSNKK